MYGSYRFPVNIKEKDIEIRIEKIENFYTYTREIPGEKVEKVIVANEGELIVNPVEPCNLPIDFSDFLNIEFEKNVVLEPKSSKKIFLKFPIEIGVFLYNKKDIEILDIFALVKQKYTLYGEPRNGIICRYWESGVYLTMPEIDPYREGVLSLRINNDISEWTNVTKAVFNASAMKIYYNEIVSMRAVMDISGKKVAETYFRDSPLEAGMSKSLELYTARKIPIVGRKMLMEWGI